jgi:glycosyltransferase involved in cell wall biosynthesis
VRILLANDHATPMGGAEIAMAALRDGLRERGHHVELLSTTASSVDAEPDAEHLAAGTLHPRGRVVLETYNPSAARRMAQALRRLRPDVVHLRLFLTQLSPAVLPRLRSVPTVHQIVFYKPICPKGTKLLNDGSPCVHPAGLACLREGCTSVLSWPFAQAQRGLYRRWSDAIDVRTALSRSSAAMLEDAGLGPVEVIPNGVAARPPRPPLGPAPVVGYAGRLVLDKGPDLLLEAFARLAVELPTARLVLVGDGPLREPLRARAVQLGIADRVELPGHLDRDAVERTLDPAWVQAVPGRWAEPFGTVTLEAAVRGTVVVATDLGGPGELVRDHGLGTVVPPGDVDALADALRRHLTDRDLAERAGAAARTAVTARFTHDRVVDRFEALYARLVAATTR